MTFGIWVELKSRLIVKKHSTAAEVQPRQDQEYPRDEWRRRRRQTDRHTEGCVEDVAFFNF